MVFVKRIGESNSLCESYRKTTDAVFSVAKPISDLSLPAGYSSKVFGTPWFSHDALKLLVFALHMGKNPGIDLWQTHRDSLDDPWHELRSLGATVNSRAADYAPSMSRDGITLYWFRPNPSNVFNGDLWTAVRANEDADFTDSKKLNAIINTDASEQHPFPTADGLRLLFDRGTPEPRLWEAIRDDVRGDFNKVIRVGLPETWRDKCAYAPSMTADGKLLVFTSNRIPGKEGFESGELWQSQCINQD